MSTSPAPVGHQGVRVEITERPARAVTGWLGVAAVAACILVTNYALRHSVAWAWVPIVVGVLIALSLAVVPPGQTSVVQFFGSYVGTVRRPGFWWVLPLTVRRRVSVRVRNFETSRLKVNDSEGNPVEIAAIVVWQVADTARSTYAVDDYENFVTRPGGVGPASRRHQPSLRPGGRRGAVAARLDRPGRR